MLERVFTIAANSYLESVRARILHGLFALAVITVGYSLVVGAYALRDTLRVVSDLGAASVSLYGLIVAVVIGATSLYREIELKTLFPILARPIRRWEYVLGKFLGTWITLGVFVLANTGLLLTCVALLSGRSMQLSFLLWGVLMTTLGAVLVKAHRLRTYVFLPWAILAFMLGYWLAGTAPNDRQVLATSAVLTLCEVAIVSSVATVFASFSSPFLTALFTFGVVIVGRSADALMHLPIRVFGAVIVKMAALIGAVVPNLMLYLPSRSLMAGEVPDVALSGYIMRALAHSVGWCIALIALASTIFQRRDFQ